MRDFAKARKALLEIEQRYPWVEVWWVDHESWTDGGWRDLSEAGTSELVLCHSRGWLIYEDEDRVEIVSCISSHEQASSGDVISRGSIVAMFRDGAVGGEA